jgi:hypothetical protein
MIVEQSFDVISNVKHINEPVMIRVKKTDGDEIVSELWEDWGAKIYAVEQQGSIVVIELPDGTLFRADREAVKLKR